MKKFTIIGMALCLAFALAAPVMAVDADFSGTYRVRGFYTEHWDLDDTSASNAYMDMRFRLQTVFKVNDILSVTTRFEALDDEVWGDTPNDEEADIDFDRAYMTINAPIGTFFVGRQCETEGVWGTSFLDTEEEADSIKYVKKIDNLTLSAIFEKDEEKDANLAKDVSDEDSDTYYLLGKYKMENITPGLLLAFTNDKTTPSATTRVYTAIPYFVSKFGPLAIQGELAYKWGETEFDSGTADRDIKKLAYNVEATYNFGPASVMAGYAFVSGDVDDDDDEDSAYGGVGEDWEKLFILTYDEFPVNNLRNMGNLVDTGDYGAKIIYGGATFSPLENLELGVVAGTAIADEVPANWEDDFGAEYDLTLNWKIYDNLTYTAIAAFLDAGDIWKGEAATEIEDTFALFHQLELSF